jgi:hypothetical protein
LLAFYNIHLSLAHSLLWILYLIFSEGFNRQIYDSRTIIMSRYWVWYIFHSETSNCPNSIISTKSYIWACMMMHVRGPSYSGNTLGPCSRRSAWATQGDSVKKKFQSRLHTSFFMSYLFSVFQCRRIPSFCLTFVILAFWKIIDQSFYRKSFNLEFCVLLKVR